MRLAPLLALLLCACPIGGGLGPPGNDDDDDVTPPEEEEPDSWLYTGVVLGTEDLVEVFVGEDRTTSAEDGTWSLMSEAGPQERVDVLHNTSQAQTFVDCEREHDAWFWDASEGVEEDRAELSVVVVGAPSAEAVSGVFVVWDASSVSTLNLSSWDLEEDGDDLRLERTVPTGAGWRLHLWALVDGALAMEGELSGGQVLADAFVEGEITLVERTFDVVTVEGAAPPSATEMRLSETIETPGGRYSATIYEGPTALSVPLPRLTGDGSLSVSFSLAETADCTWPNTSIGLEVVAGAAELGPLLDAPGFAPTLGYWTTAPEIDLRLPDDAEQGYFSIYGTNGFGTTWWAVNTRPGCAPPALAWPEQLDRLDPTGWGSATAYAWRGAASSYCGGRVEFPEL